METVDQLMQQLRALATRASAGENVSHERAVIEQKLVGHGIRVQSKGSASGLAGANPAISEQAMQQVAAQIAARAEGMLAARRGGSRFVGQDADMEAIQAAVAAGVNQGGQVAQRAGQGRGSLAATMTKALAESTPSAGGVLVPPEVSRDIVELIRARVAVMTLGPTIVHVAKSLDLPFISTGSTASYVAENARIPVSEPTFTTVPKLTPLELAALLPVSNRLLRDAQTNPSLEEALRTDMADSLSGRQDLAFLQGLGGGAEPLGIRNQTGISVIGLGANGSQPTLSDFRKVIGTVRGRNATFSKPAWIFHPAVLTWLENMTDSTGRPLLEGDLLKIDATGGGGYFLGYRFVTTSRIPTNLTVGTSTDATYVLFGSDWQECWIGENLQLTLEASGDASYSPDGGSTHVSAYQARQTVFRALSAHDIALRRPEFFAALEGVRL